jgi:hypothetical protein
MTSNPDPARVDVVGRQNELVASRSRDAHRRKVHTERDLHRRDARPYRPPVRQRVVEHERRAGDVSAGIRVGEDGDGHAVRVLEGDVEGGSCVRAFAAARPSALRAGCGAAGAGTRSQRRNPSRHPGSAVHRSASTPRRTELREQRRPAQGLRSRRRGWAEPDLPRGRQVRCSYSSMPGRRRRRVRREGGALS